MLSPNEIKEMTEKEYHDATLGESLVLSPAENLCKRAYNYSHLFKSQSVGQSIMIILGVHLLNPSTDGCQLHHLL